MDLLSLLVVIVSLGLVGIAVYDKAWGNLTLAERKRRRGRLTVLRRLNGWQRIGVVISGLWILCFSAVTLVMIIESITDKDRITTSGDIAAMLAFLIGGSLIPVIAFWLIAFVIIQVIRWVIAGFRNQN
jgi:hypothetical protein